MPPVPLGLLDSHRIGIACRPCARHDLVYQVSIVRRHDRLPRSKLDRPIVASNYLFKRATLVQPITFTQRYPVLTVLHCVALVCLVWSGLVFCCGV